MNIRISYNNIIIYMTTEMKVHVVTLQVCFKYAMFSSTYIIYIYIYICFQICCYYNIYMLILYYYNLLLLDIYYY